MTNDEVAGDMAAEIAAILTEKADPLLEALRQVGCSAIVIVHCHDQLTDYEFTTHAETGSIYANRGAMQAVMQQTQ